MLKRWIAATLVCTTLNTYAGQTEFPNFDTENTKLGITPGYSQAALEKLIAAIRTEIGMIKPDAKSKDPAKAAAKAAGIVDALTQILEREIQKPSAVSNYHNLKAYLYVLRSNRLGAQGGSGGAVGNFLSGDLTFPYVAPANRDKAIGEKAALLESSDLMDASGKIYSTPKELAGLSTNEISQLDVSPSNNLWYTEDTLKQIKAIYGSNWNYIEHRMEEAVSKKEGKPYKLDTARRILKFEAIKNSATSPKVDTTDLYGQGWKLKWGEEAQTEPVANRLYANLGGKLQDLVYANTGGMKDVILVLDKAEDDTNPKACNKIATLGKLKDCLLKEMCLDDACTEKTTYEFDLSPYVIENKKITQEMLDNPELTFGLESPEKRQELLGREYVVFNESMVEFQPTKDIAIRLGSSPFSNAGALEDRAKRALVMYSYFINNKDAKDDNNRAVAIDGELVEYMHDLGASLGNRKWSGLINIMVPDFAVVKGNNVSLTLGVLYKPDSFKQVSFADAKWMARKIVALTEDDIRSAVAATKWPDFQQEILAQMLLYRKNVVSKLFSEGSQENLHANAIQIDLRTRKDREAAAEKYGITLKTNGDLNQATNLIEATMKNAGLKIDANGNSTYVDTVGVVDGSVLRTAECSASVMVSVLESTVRPAGLSRRAWRRTDNQPLEACAPKKLK